VPIFILDEIPNPYKPNYQENGFDVDDFDFDTYHMQEWEDSLEATDITIPLYVPRRYDSSSDGFYTQTPSLQSDDSRSVEIILCQLPLRWHDDDSVNRAVTPPIL
jgi:hypothetical protein